MGLRGGGRPADPAFLVPVIRGLCEEEAEGAASSGSQCVSVTCLRSFPVRDCCRNRSRLAAAACWSLAAATQGGSCALPVTL